MNIVADPVYIIGIDLGTTNSVISYTEATIERGKTPDIRVLEIPQLVGPGAVEKRSMLPSFVLLPGEHDVPQDALTLPWGNGNRHAVGEFARERGAELPQRLISSSKSWLCHTLVDRNKPILPWEGPADIDKLSPVEASAVVLRHIRDSWNHTMAAEDDRLRIEHQDILLTVPASFDAVARELTVKAAASAGMTNITLIEEPMAAFYAWIESNGEKWRDIVQKDDMVLVCDVGGGTTDFSLIRVSEDDGDLLLERIAVGEHLLVGGDNMDLALAYSVSRRLAEKGTRLDSWQLRGLWHHCRNAKEKIFSDPDTTSLPLTVLGRGSSLIGGTIRTELNSDEVETIILDGFFPKCSQTDRPQSSKSAGIREMGLAYEADPAVTRHLANFLSQPHLEEGRQFILPTAVLFNGGVMKAASLRERVLDVFGSWGESSGEPTVREIESLDFDLAVARGAVYYGLARRGDGIRIRGGLNKTYYIGIAASMPAVPGMPTPTKALCVAPFGMEEGTGASLDRQEFVLVVGEPVKFDFLGSPVRYDDPAGAVVEDWEGEIEEITTLETTLDGEPGTTIPVTLEVRVTEIGTLEIWCVSQADGNRWKLEFNVREKDSRA